MKDDKPDAGSIPPRRKRYRVTGKQLGMKAVVAKAMIETGATYRNIREATGISEGSIAGLKKVDLVSPGQAEQIRRGLRNQFAVVAQQILTSVDQKKIDVAGLGETLRAAGIAADRAGIGPVSHVEIYKTSITKYEKTATGARPGQSGEQP